MQGIQLGERTVAPDPETDITTAARYMADQLCRGFVHHDRRNRREAIRAFANVDGLQFAHLDTEGAKRTATAYVDALWAKDAVEEEATVDGQLDREALAGADWSTVEAAFDRRASVAKMNPQYAELSTVGWREHKLRGDYWTPLQRAQTYELRAALQDADYPNKPRYGQSGFGPEPARYLLGIELHDTRRWEEAREAMAPYFERILREHVEN